ncbi:MAG TPA: alpha/beta hydrolase-fold protein [Vicinamibacterales bacterium]|nr:alpha/beta hydrolase-fold protein [Vicinamibacterales bacterium]
MTLRTSGSGRLAGALAAALAMAAGAWGCQRAGRPIRFRVTMPKAMRSAPADGRLIILLSRDPAREPRLQIAQNVNTQQLFGVNVDGVPPGGSATLAAPDAVGYPIESLAGIPAGEYTVQALLNVYDTFHRKDGKAIKAAMDRWEGQKWNTKPGNLYSVPRRMWVDPEHGGTIDLSLDKQIPELPYPKDTKYVKYVRIESKLLSEFWGRKWELGAFVLLPDGFDEHPEAHYPLVVNPAHFPTGINAFSTMLPDPTARASERTAAEGAYNFYKDWTSGKVPRMLVMAIQHPTPYYDDSYGVNSVNNGPFGDAITQELIPYVEKTFRGIGQPWARALTGCSTGGWEALGMQIMYPDFYNGTWAGAPSPIDFRAWRLVNIYDDNNAYWYEGGWGRVPRPSIGARGSNDVAPKNRMEDDHVALTMEQDNYLELAVGDRGRGAGLWDGMQAVFGPIGSDGYPKPIWDKRTGVIDHDVATFWRDHADLSYILRRDWTTIGPKLAGKIHLTVGTTDQWYLANAVRYVDAFLKSTKDPYFDGSVEYGDRFIHCYQGDPDKALAQSSRTVFQRQMPQMAERMLKTAPPGADVRSWRY